MANEQLLRFYAGIGTDDRGRTIEDVWRLSFDDLEDIHDYIQWLFPLAERSAFNPGAPLVDAETARRFEGDPVLRQNLERSLRVMLGFYGLEIDVQRIVRAPSFAGRARNWLTPHNHNFLRLTRVLKSLALLGAGDRATQLLACLEDIYREQPVVVGSTTFGYWQTAV